MITRNMSQYTWYDTETSGINPALDMIYQFAAITTDPDFNIIKEHNVIVKPRMDVIPHPMAFMTHQIDINTLHEKGITELELAKKVGDIFLGTQNNCIAGYNTIKFDDEMIRHLMYRNLKQPYEHEYKNSNLKFDVFKLVQLAYAFSPEILSWPTNDKGDAVSMKLESLSKANGIIHENAHEALSDVRATIELARIIKEARPKIFDYALNLTNKKNAESLLIKREPLIAVDTLFGKDFSNLGYVLPVAVDMESSNKYLTVDLRYDPSELLEMTPEDISYYLFTKRDELPDSSPFIAVKTFQTNKQPLLVEPKHKLTPDIINKMQIDVDAANKYSELIKKDKGFPRRLAQAFNISRTNEQRDAFESLYSGGFLDNTDMHSAQRLISLPVNKPEDKQEIKLERADIYKECINMKDKTRMFPIMLRAKWNNFYKKILDSNEYSRAEMKEWVEHLENTYYSEHNNHINLTDFYTELEKVKIESFPTEEQLIVLDKMEKYIRETEENFKSLKELVNEEENIFQDEMKKNMFIEKMKNWIKEKDFSQNNELLMET